MATASSGSKYYIYDRLIVLWDVCLHVDLCVMELLNSAGETQELHEGNAAMPSIIVVTPEDCSRDIIPTVLQDSQQQSVNISALPPSLVHTARPPL